MRTVLLFIFTAFTIIKGTQASAKSSDAASSNSNKFFSAVHWEGFDATMDKGNVRLDWKIALEENVQGFEIQRSTDSNSFKKIGYTVYNTRNEYTYRDEVPSNGSVYYRIKAIDKDGRYSYSSIMRIYSNAKAVSVLRAFPVPAQSRLTLQHSEAGRGARFTLSGSTGIVYTAVVPEAGAQQTEISLSSLKPGCYIVRFEDGKGKTEVIKIIRQ